ncbi:hypothetical protein [Stackebrandtia nassauensis]|uniref:Uncharacterized protein n=1 Tax=Stackebrandtia nassauensis (strain DSM 44728 / CIP 108903 / NRRL B-16338 / NBRC 102104 / LLR-40K-21) TaxID=446470 RepID=D3Q585_STANL|nr:hypothetical protein [Stackebrandtia nassauensis]ADD44134.1 hypothetical protein Snas_4489 [Stackebrandtia nassauensis DSM 44728]
MNHWHKMEIRPREFTDHWGDDIGVYLRPPRGARVGRLLAQVVLDEWADSMGRKAPRLTTRNLVGRVDEPWPKDFKKMFDEPAPIEVRRVKRRRK